MLAVGQALRSVSYSDITMYWKFVDFLYFFDDDAAVFTSTRHNFFDDDTRDSTTTTTIDVFLDDVVQ